MLFFLKGLTENKSCMLLILDKSGETQSSLVAKLSLTYGICSLLPKFLEAFYAFPNDLGGKRLVCRLPFKWITIRNIIAFWKSTYFLVNGLSLWGKKMVCLK